MLSDLGTSALASVELPKDIPSGFVQVITLSNDVIQSTPVSKFVWLEKTDGTRTVLLIERGCIFNVTNINNIIIVKSNLKSPKCIGRTVLDTEAYDGKYIVFDAIMIDDVNVAAEHYIERMSKMQQFIKDVGEELSILKSADYFALHSWDTLMQFIKHYKSPKTSRIIDGVICQRIDMPYFKLTGPAPVYKLKMPSMNTVDFYLRWVNEECCYYIYLFTNDFLFRTSCRKLPKINKYMQEHTGNDPYRTLPDGSYVLFASPFYSNVSKFYPRSQWNTKDYFPPCIEHANELMKDMLANPMKYDKAIVELSFAADGWVPFRVRSDKQHSNSYYVGFSNMAVLFDPINPNQEAYFADESSLTTNESTINIYHECSHVIRQYMFESLFAKYKQKILEDNQREYNERKSKTMGFANGQAGFDEDDVDVNDSASERSTFSQRSMLTGGSLSNIYESPTFDRCIYESDMECNILSDFNANDFSDSRITITEYNPSPSNSKQTNQRPKIMFHKVANSISLLDIAGGRGSDFFTYCNLGVTNLFATDADRSALVKYAKKRVSVVHNVHWRPVISSTMQDPHDDVYLNLLHYFLSENNEPMIKEIKSRLEYPRNGFDIIVMNYAFHYICYSKLAVEELAKTIATLINKEHGVFIMTYVDGDRVMSIMNGNIAKCPPFMIELVDRTSTNEFKNGDEDMQLVKMPLPTIDASGYRIEPLVTRKYIEIMTKYLKIVDEYNLVESAKEYINKIASHSIATNYLGLFKATVFEAK